MARSNRTGGRAPSPIKPFPVVDAEQTICVLSVGQAFRVQNAFLAFQQAQQNLAAVAQEVGFDPNGAYRIEDDGRLIKVNQPTAPVMESE